MMGDDVAVDAIDRPRSTLGVRSEVDAVLGELRISLAAILEGLRPPVMRASQLGERLQLDKKLSWSIFSAATASDTHVLASLLPGRRAMERFFAAALAHGAGESLIQRGRTAFVRFEGLVARRAGSRDAFETIVADLRGGGGTGSDLKHRRAAFRAMSMLWGRQARVVCGARIMHPSATAGLLDTVFIKGMMGVRRTRRNVPLHMTAYRARTRGPNDPATAMPEPLDPREMGSESIGLLREFCSQPPPEFRIREGAHGYRCHELISDDLGPSGEVTYFTGEVCRGDTAGPESDPHWVVSLSKTMDIPIEVFMADLVIHRSLCDVRVPAVRVFAMPLDGSLEICETDLLPMAESAQYLGEGVEAAMTPLVPRHGEMLAYAMDVMKWKGEEFRVFRCRVEYPVLYTRILMSLRRE